MDCHSGCVSTIEKWLKYTALTKRPPCPPHKKKDVGAKGDEVTYLPLKS